MHKIEKLKFGKQEFYELLIPLLIFIFIVISLTCIVSIVETII